MGSNGGKFHFFTYDAWGHQTDLQRRTILEELTSDLVKGQTPILNENSWKDSLENLFSKEETYDYKNNSCNWNWYYSKLVLDLADTFCYSSCFFGFCRMVKASCSSYTLCRSLWLFRVSSLWKDER